MIYLVPSFTALLTLAGAVLLLPWTNNRWRGWYYTHLVRLGAVLWGLLALLSVLLLKRTYAGDSWCVTLPWWSLSVAGHAWLSFSVSFRLDFVAAVMLWMTTTVGALVYVYSLAYMRPEPGAPRYFALLTLFLGAMLVLLLANDLLTLFIGWELLSWASYLLIGFWYQRAASAAASTKALVFNQLGSLFLLAGLLVIQRTVGSLTLPAPGAALAPATDGWLTVAGICFLGAAAAKSAQLPLSYWLPAAMEAPTPVSALMHAATLVSAGAYLLLRVSPWLTPTVQLLTSMVGSMTALWGAWMALQQYHLKRLLAYSTISQMGYVVMATGIGAPSAAVLHLVAHAFAKAALFLGAGIVSRFLQAHAVHSLEAQDLRSMGGLRSALPGVFYPCLIATLAVIGVPGCAGFWSKEAILAAALYWTPEVYAGQLWTYGLLVAVWGATFLTAIYMSRQCWAIFMGRPRWQPARVAQPGGGTAWQMQLSLWLLAIASLSFVYGPGWGAYWDSWLWKQLQATMTDIGLAWQGIHSAATVLSVSTLCVGLFIGYLQRRWAHERCSELRQPKVAGEIILAAITKIYLRCSQCMSWAERRALQRSLCSLSTGYTAMCRIVCRIEQQLWPYALDGVGKAYTAMCNAIARAGQQWSRGVVVQMARLPQRLGQHCIVLQSTGVQYHVLCMLVSVVLLLASIWLVG
ncbi:MAG: proton-conducting transporter membrane subunit [Bacteroidota bacterium]